MSSYFSNNYKNLQLKEESTNAKGFRKAQLGAIHATSAHFYQNSQETAIISMPTGTGKTAVFQSICYMLKAKKVMIVVPSSLLRSQIYNDFKELNTLKKDIECIPKASENPKVKKITEVINNSEKWKEYSKVDVVITTPNCIGTEGLPNPEFFDLVILDEGHRSEAKTFARILKNTSKSTKKILITATPFRRDKKLLKGKIIFHYTMKQALLDNTIVPVDFVDCSKISKFKKSDEMIAREVESLITKHSTMKALMSCPHILSPENKLVLRG